VCKLCIEQRDLAVPEAVGNCRLFSPRGSTQTCTEFGISSLYCNELHLAILIITLLTRPYNCSLDRESGTVLPPLPEYEVPVTAIDSLMLEAKQAILDEQRRRFQILQQEGRWQEVLQQIHITRSCAADLLNESLRILDETIETHNHTLDDRSVPPSPAP